VGTPTTPHPAGLASPLTLPTAYHAAFNVLSVSFFAFVLVSDFSSTPVRADLELLPTAAALRLDLLHQLGHALRDMPRMSATS
jgi:hypothetical protein